MSFVNDYLYSRAMRTNPQFAQQEQARIAAEQAAQMQAAQQQQIQSLWGEYAGQQATPEQVEQTQYQMSPDEMMEGEAPIQGLFDEEITPAQAASGIYSQDPAERQQAILALSYLSPDQERVKQFAGHSEGLFDNVGPAELTDFQRKQQWFQENPEAYQRFVQAGQAPQKPSAFAEKMQWLQNASEEDIAAAKEAGVFGGQTINVGQQGPTTPGRKKIDEKFAETYVDWASSGFADTQKQLSQLEEVKTMLESGRDDLTGGFVGNLPPKLREIVAEESVIAQEAVEEVVQRNLREVLGAQFTEKEGERLISRAYNPRLSEEENAKRVGRLINQIQEAAMQKASAIQYMDEHGTLEGWKGKLPSWSDFSVTDITGDDGASTGGELGDGWSYSVN